MSEQDAECLFCKIVAGEIPADKLYEDEVILGFRDIHPQAPLHGLVIPKVHIATLNDFDTSQGDLLAGLLLAARRIALDQGLPGYRVAMNVDRAGGQVIFHAHLHVIGGRALSGKLG